jgi:hypothetical protein
VGVGPRCRLVEQRREVGRAVGELRLLVVLVDHPGPIPQEGDVALEEGLLARVVGLLGIRIAFLEHAQHHVERGPRLGTVDLSFAVGADDFLALLVDKRHEQAHAVRAVHELAAEELLPGTLLDLLGFSEELLHR